MQQGWKTLVSSRRKWRGQRGTTTEGGVGFTVVQTKKREKKRKKNEGDRAFGGGGMDRNFAASLEFAKEKKNKNASKEKHLNNQTK